MENIKQIPNSTFSPAISHSIERIKLYIELSELRILIDSISYKYFLKSDYLSEEKYIKNDSKNEILMYGEKLFKSQNEFIYYFPNFFNTTKEHYEKILFKLNE